MYWLCQVLDRAEKDLSKSVKPYFMPHKVYKQIEKLQQDPDYAFDEVPMPYDLASVENAGDKSVIYTILPARTSTPLTVEERRAVEEAGTVQDVQEALRAKDGAPKTPVSNTDDGLDVAVDMGA